LLTLDEVVAALPGDEDQLRAWLRRKVQATSPGGLDIYRWRDVLDALGRQPRKATGYGACDLVTVAEAVAILGLRAEDARAWLRAKGLVHDVEGRRRVVVGDLVEAVRQPRTASPWDSVQLAQLGSSNRSPK